MPTPRAVQAQPLPMPDIPAPLLPAGAGPTTEAIAALDGALAAAMPNFGPLVKDAENTYLKTAYMPLDTLLEAIRPALLAQGVLITSCFQLVPGGFVVITCLAHAGGGWRSSLFPVGDPGNPQKVAAAATYGLRINLMQLLAVVASDDDGQGFAGHAPQAAMPQAAAPAAWPQPGQAVQAPPAMYPPTAPPPAAPPPAVPTFPGGSAGAPVAPPMAPPPVAAPPPGAWQAPPAPAPAPAPYV